jgi:hypothetical protein
MSIRIILLILISLYIFVYGKEEGNKSRLLSNDSSKSRMKQLQSPTDIYYINSTYRYVRILIWYKLRTPKQLKVYFAKFELLKFKEQWLDDRKADVIKQSASIYERFILFYYSKKQSIITVFLKLNLQNTGKKFLIKSTNGDVEQNLKKYDFIPVYEYEIFFTILRWLPTLLFFGCIILSSIWIVTSLMKLCQKCKKKNVKNSRYIHTENLLNQNAQNKSRLQDVQNCAKIDIQNLSNQNIESESRLQNVQNWVDHINEYQDSPDSEKKSFVDFDNDSNSLSNNS